MSWESQLRSRIQEEAREGMEARVGVEQHGTDGGQQVEGVPSK